MLKLSLSVSFLVACLLPLNAQTVSDSITAMRHLEAARYILSEQENYTDSLAFHVNSAAASFKKDNQWRTYALEFINFAQALYDASYYSEGIQLLQQLQVDIQHMAMEEQKNEIYYQIGRGYYFKQEYDTSIAIIEANLLRLVQTASANKDASMANHYNLIGSNCRGQGRLLQAIENYQQAYNMRKETYGLEHNLVASVLNNLGVTYADLGLYNKALDYYTQAFAIREKILGRNHPSLATLMLNMGNLYDEKGEYNKAAQYYDRALSIFQTNPRSFALRIADTFTNLAITYGKKGSYQEAAAFNEQALLQYKQLATKPLEKIANVYANQANLAEFQKDYDKAIALQQQAITFYTEALGDTHLRVIVAQNNQGINYYKNGAYAEALSQFQNVALLLENNPEQRKQYANVCNDLADVYLKLKNITEAKAYSQKALAIQQDIWGKKSYQLAYTFNNLAQIAEAEGDRTAALQYVQAALAANHLDFEAEEVAAAPSPNGFLKYDYFVESLMYKARLLRSGGDQTALLQAKFLYEVTDSVLTQVRNELLSTEDKIRFSEKFYELSQAAIEICLQLAETTGDQRYLEQAFRFSEKSKSNVLAQSIAANQAKYFAGIPDSLVVLENQLQSDINFYQLQLADQPDSLQRMLYQNELFSAQRQYRILIANFEKNYDAYYQLKYDQIIPRIRAIQFSMPANTAIVSYFIGDSVLYSFVVTKNDFNVYRSPLSKNFYDQQIGLRKSIVNKLNQDYVELAQQFYKILFPFSLGKNIQSLCIIADGALSKLPFEALLSRKTNPKMDINFSNLPYLVNEYEVSYALSARLYYQKQTMTTVKSFDEGLLAYAPVFDEPQSVGFFADGTRNPLAVTETTRTMILNGEFIAALPATALEIEQIESVFKQKGQKATTYLFKNASEKQFKQSNLSRSRYLHIATHGFINEAQPNLSGLLLFPDFTSQEDHILYSGEVYNMNLNADLVVLSACETGLGKVANGEGLLGLSRAFLYAGADNLIVSLWKVQDQATAYLMVAFYQAHLNRKAQYFREPLRQAKLELIRSEKFNHPYYWSAFVLIGQ